METVGSTVTDTGFVGVGLADDDGGLTKRADHDLGATLAVGVTTGGSSTVDGST